MVGRQTLNLVILVRVQVPEPDRMIRVSKKFGSCSEGIGLMLASPIVNRRIYHRGSNSTVDTLEKIAKPSA